MIWFRLVGALLFLSLCSCVSNQLIEKKEYQPTYKAFHDENYIKSLEVFPKKESQHFITTLEKAYLSLFLHNKLNDQDMAKLIKMAKSIEEKDVIYLSNEVQNLFYVETDEGYFPAEHEIYWMHLILGLHYIKRSELSLARVHAQKVSELFSRINSRGEKYFDDASLRVLSASLWMAVGEWDRAQVDLRRAMDLNPQLKLDKIVSASTMPATWNVIFRGGGYKAEFDSSKLENKLSGLQGINFLSKLPRLEYPESYLFVGNTSGWYPRHLYRNHEIKNVVDKSKYMSRMFKSELESTTLNVLTTAATGVVITTGVAIGVGLVGGGIYLLAQSGSSSGEAVGYIIALGFTIGSELYTSGMRFYNETTTKIKEDKNEYQDVSRFYRYVRFIPEEFYLSLVPIENKLWFPLLAIKQKNTQINFYFLNK